MKHLIPHFILDNYQRGIRSGELDAVSLFVDLSGFTTMTDRLMRQGKLGGEILAHLMMHVFDPLVGSVQEQGGFIIGFAGDAFTALFPLPDGVAKTDAMPYRRAVSAAHQIQQHLLTQPEHTTPYGTFQFGVKLGVAAGAVQWGICDGVEATHPVYFFKGPAIDGCATAEHAANSGQLILHRQVADHLGQMIQTQPLEDTDHAELARVVYLRRPPEPALPSPPDALAVEACAFVPKAIQNLQAPGEFRQIATAFISLQGDPPLDQMTELGTQLLRLNAQYGGTVFRFDFGDKGATIPLFWGAPVQYENDVERALNFLLDFRKASPIPIRAGVTTEMMYAGFVGATTRSEYSCYGSGINLAARQAMQAEWGEIWLDEATTRQAGLQFEVEWVDHFTFKGIEGKRRICRLVGRGSAYHSLFYQGPMVGRQNELEQLQQVVEPIFPSVSQKRRPHRFAGFCLVSGEAGMGKTRLMYEFEQLLRRSHPIHWCYCPCDEILRQPLNPFKTFLRSYFHQTLHAEEAANRQQFEGRFEELLTTLEEIDSPSGVRQMLIGELKRTRSILAALIDLAYEDSLYQRLDPKLRFDNMLYTVKTVIKALTLISPTILFIDDLQWVDPDSIQLMQTLTRNTSSFPLAILATSRLAEGNGALTFDATVAQQQIQLDVLTREGIKAIADHVTGGNVGADVVDFLARQTDGNPFFVEQLALDLKERQMLTPEPDPEMPTDPPKLTLRQADLNKLPAGINTVLVSRLDRLSQEVRQVVQTASVLGWEFEIPVLRHMLQHDRDLEPKMRQAAQAAIWAAKTDLHYMFKHSLMRGAAYEMQLRSRLQKLHQLAGEAIEEVEQADLSPFYADIAYHYEQAALKAKAIQYLEMAAEQARINYQNQQAIEFYDRLLAVLNQEIKHLDNTDASATRQEYIRRCIDIRLKKSGIYRITSEWLINLENLELALQLARDIADRLREGQLLREMGDAQGGLGNPDSALSLLNQALEIFDALGKDGEKGRAHSGLGIIYSSTGDYNVSLKHALLALAAAEKADHPQRIATCCGNIGTVYLRKGEYDEARRFLGRKITICKRIGDRLGLAGAHGNLGSLAMEMTDYDQAMAHYEETVKIMAEFGDRSAEAGYTCNIGILHFYQGRFEEARVCYQKLLDISKELGDKYGLALAFSNIGLLEQSIGRYDSALEFYQKSLAICQETKRKTMIAISYGNIGGIYYLTKEYPRALAEYERAIEMGRELGITFFLCGFLVSYAVVSFAKGDYDTADHANQEGLELARKLKRADKIFQAELTAIKIDFAHGDTTAIERLREKISLTDDEMQLASLHYELVQMNPPQVERHRQVARLLYQKLWERTPKLEFQERIDELSAK